MPALNLYALLVGINQYPAPVPPLRACISDVISLESYLMASFPEEHLHIRKLIDEDALRSKVIEAFRNHLAQASKGDVALFYFAGHGSRQPSAVQFTRGGRSSEGMDETLVCYDSRTLDGLDLADNEIAVLLAEVAQSGARIICLFDCCHASGVTRSSNPEEIRARYYQPNLQVRLLETYLTGHFAQQDFLSVPEAPHLALSACRRDETALEIDGRGLFTESLLIAWRRLGHDIGIYALQHEIEMLMEARVRPYNRHQHPQLAVYASFQPHTTLFTGIPTTFNPRFRVYKRGEQWVMNRGALDGLTTVGQQLQICDPTTQAIWSASLRALGPEKSRIKFDSPPPHSFQGAMGHPRCRSEMKIYIAESGQFQSLVRQHIQAIGISRIIEVPRAEADFSIQLAGHQLLFQNLLTPSEAISYAYSEANLAQHLHDFFYHAIRWKNGLNMAGAGLNKDEIDFYFARPDGSKIHGNHISYPVTAHNSKARILIMGKNRSHHPVYFTLLYFQQQLAIHAFSPIPVPPQSYDVVLFGQAPQQYVYLGPEEASTINLLRLLVSYRKPDWLLLGQAKLHPTGPVRSASVEHSAQKEASMMGRWCMKPLTLRLER